jgi:hypothetical protein
MAGAVWLARTSLAAPPAQYQIVPRAGVRYPPSFLTFAARRRFDSLAAAVASVADRRLGFNVVKVA